MLLACLPLGAEDGTVARAGAKGMSVWPIINLGEIFTQEWWKGEYGLVFESEFPSSRLEYLNILYSVSLRGIWTPESAALPESVMAIPGISHRAYADASVRVLPGLHARLLERVMLGDDQAYGYAESTIGVLWNGGRSVTEIRDNGIEAAGDVTVGLSPLSPFYLRADGRLSYYVSNPSKDFTFCPSIWVDGDLGTDTPLHRSALCPVFPRTMPYEPFSSPATDSFLCRAAAIVNVSARKILFRLFERSAGVTDNPEGKASTGAALGLGLDTFAGIAAPRSDTGPAFVHGYGVSLYLLNTRNGSPASYMAAFSIFADEGVFTDPRRFFLSANISSNPFQMNLWI
jgi:hypothetical protein